MVTGDTILDKRRYVKKNLDHLRKMLMHEPRGHKEMYGIIPVTADIQEADVAMLFMHNEGLLMFRTVKECTYQLGCPRALCQAFN